MNRSQFVAVGLTSALASSLAVAEQNRFYVRADVGGAATRDVELREFFGQALIPGSEISLDPGVRLGVRAGYGITDWFAAEVETGVTANNIDTISGATQAEGSLASVPLLLNARFHLPDNNRVSPYAGVGVGLANTILTADRITIGGTSLDGSTAAATFAFQAFAGVDFSINDTMSLGVEYRYFHADRSNMTADITVGTPTDRVKIGEIQSHALSVAFKVRF